MSLVSVFEAHTSLIGQWGGRALGGAGQPIPEGPLGCDCAGSSFPCPYYARFM